MANPKEIDYGTKEYCKLESVANILQALSPNGAQYFVSDCFFDIGQNWVWTTIIRNGFRDCQILCPRDWERIITAETPQDIADVVEAIRHDRFFGDV